MFHSHTGQFGFNKKTIICSGVLLVITLGLAVLSIILFEFSKIEQVYCLLVPFLIHIVISIFSKQKVSWMLGATVATIISLLIFVLFVIFLMVNEI